MVESKKLEDRLLVIDHLQSDNSTATLGEEITPDVLRAVVRKQNKTQIPEGPLDNMEPWQAVSDDLSISLSAFSESVLYLAYSVTYTK